MKKFLIALMVALTTASMAVSEAEAKRMGGGSSIGKQSSGISRQAPAQNQATNPSQAQQATPPAAAPQTMPQKPASPWRNILGGALLGLGLGALLSHFGIGGALASLIASVLMIALLVMAVMFILRLVRNRNGANHGHHPQPAYAGGNPSFRTPDIGSRTESQSQPAAFQAEPSASAGAAPASLNLPPEFDAAAFLRHAKTYYIRLQSAWDRADINDIREFTTPEMFAELRLQLQERGASPNFTDVVSLEAELVGFERSGDDYMASVKFSGMIKEAENAPVEPFAEVWNMTKPVSGQGGWVLAGIQQLS